MLAGISATLTRNPVFAIINEGHQMKQKPKETCEKKENCIISLAALWNLAMKLLLAIHVVVSVQRQTTGRQAHFQLNASPRITCIHFSCGNHHTYACPFNDDLQQNNNNNKRKRKENENKIKHKFYVHLSDLKNSAELWKICISSHTRKNIQLQIDFK